MYSQQNPNYYQPYPAQPNYVAAPQGGSNKPQYSATGGDYSQIPPNSGGNVDGHHYSHNGLSHAPAGYAPLAGEAESSVLSGEEDVQVMNETANAVNGSQVPSGVSQRPYDPQNSNWAGQYLNTNAQYGAQYDANAVSQLAMQAGQLTLNSGGQQPAGVTQQLPAATNWQNAPPAQYANRQQQPSAYDYGQQPAAAGYQQGAYGQPSVAPPQPNTGYSAAQTGGSYPPAQSGYPQQGTYRPGSEYAQSQTTGNYGQAQPQTQPGYQQNSQTGTSTGAYQGSGQQSTNRSTPQQGGARRLDPDSLPNLLQVMEDDRTKRGGTFRTGARGEVPPLTCTEFVTEDGGLSSPRFVRATMNTVPCSNDLAKQVGLPLGIVMTPLARLPAAEYPQGIPHIGGVPLADHSQHGPVRCVRCKAYMSPLMQFIDGGRRFACPLCSYNSEVPEHYFSHLDHTGKRVDAAYRPELRFGTYEVLTSADYCRNKELPPPPAYIFLLDASYQAVRTGLLQLVCSRIRDEVLLRLPGEGDESSRVRVGFMTYSNVLQFYTIDTAIGKPRMFVVSDLDDVFVPSLSHLLVQVDTQTLPLIDTLLSQISMQFATSQASETLLGPAVQAGLAALQAASTCGRLVVVHTGLPTAEAPGKLRMREDRKLIGTDKERQLLVSASSYYTKLAEQCVAAGCGVDLFLFPNAYCDVATLAELPRLTGGNLMRYPNFQADVDGERFMADLRTVLERPCGFDAVMRVRCSGGIRAVEFFGNFYMQNTNDIELGMIDSEKSIAVEIRYDDKLTEAEGCCIQIALLYTSVSGQRRLRVFNMALNASTNMADVFKSIDADAMLNIVAKSANRSLLTKNAQDVEQALTTQCVHTLACYRKNCAQPTSAGQLILPEAMKVYPQTLNGALKSSALRGCSETDERSLAMFQLNEMGTRYSIVYFYPRLISLHNADPNREEIPNPIRCSYERLQDTGAYLLENGMLAFIWLGQSCSPEFLWNVFGVNQLAQLQENRPISELPTLNNPLSNRIRQIIWQIRGQRGRHLKLTIVKQRGQLEGWFQHFLVEDQSPDGAPSYVDYLCHLHKEIRVLLA